MSEQDFGSTIQYRSKTINRKKNTALAKTPFTLRWINFNTDQKVICKSLGASIKCQVYAIRITFDPSANILFSVFIDKSSIYLIGNILFFQHCHALLLHPVNFWSRVQKQS